jgi:HEAT repeat protein
LPVQDIATHWKLLLRDEQPEVRAHAVRALGHVKLPAGSDPSKEGSESTESTESAASIVEEWLGAALDDARQEVGVAAVAALAAQGTPRALERLLAAAHDTGRATAQRVAAVRALGEAGAVPAGAGFSGLLGDSEATVRLAVLRVLVEQSNGAAGSMLADLVRGRKAGETKLAGEAVPSGEAPAGEVSAEETPPSETPPAETPSDSGASAEGVPAEGAAGEPAPREDPLQEGGDEEVETPGETGNENDDPPPPPRSTLEAIARAGENRPPPLTLEDELAAAEFPEEDAHFLQLARENLKAAQELLHPKIPGLDLHVRVEAARMLREHPADDAPEALVTALRSGEAALQEAAAETAGALRVEAAVPALTALLSAESRQVRLAAVRALGEIGQRDAESALLALAPDPDPLVRREQVSALQGTRDGRADVFLRDALGDEDPEVARAAVLSLAARGDETALPGMMAALARHPERNWRGLGNALALHLPEAGCNALLDVLQDPHRAPLVPVAIAVLEELEGARQEKGA